MPEIVDRSYFLSDEERNALNKNLQNISETIKTTKKIIRSVDDTIITLRKAADGLPMTMFAAAWIGLLLGRLDKKNYYGQARRNVSNMKSLIAEFINRLKNINENISEYKFKDYGIELEFTNFYHYYETTDISKIKNYKINKDVETLTEITAKAAKIMVDLEDLSKKLSIKFYKKT